MGENITYIDVEEVGHSELSELKAEVALILVGLSDFDTLHEFIFNNLGGTHSGELESEIIENIFSPIGEILEIIEKYNAY